MDIHFQIFHLIKEKKVERNKKNYDNNQVSNLDIHFRVRRMWLLI